jgi:hypothetical protein
MPHLKCTVGPSSLASGGVQELPQLDTVTLPLKSAPSNILSARRFYFGLSTSASPGIRRVACPSVIVNCTQHSAAASQLSQALDTAQVQHRR